MSAHAITFASPGLCEFIRHRIGNSLYPGLANDISYARCPGPNQSIVGLSSMVIGNNQVLQGNIAAVSIYIDNSRAKLMTSKSMTFFWYR